MGFIPERQEFFNIHKSINVIHCINNLNKKRDHLNTCREAFDKIQHPFIIKTLQKVSLERTYLNITKAKCNKPTENIILNSENLKAFRLRSGTRMSILTNFIQHSLEVLVTGIREEKEIERIQIGK